MELCKIYGVSRITIRRALSELEKDDLINRTSGKGTMVIFDSKANKNVTLLKSITQELSEIGKKVSTISLTIKTLNANIELSTMLNVSLNTRLLQLNRTRSVDGEIIAYSKSYFPFLEGMSIDENDYYGSLLEYLEKFDVKLTKSDDSIEAILPPQEIYEQLGTDWYEPVLKRTKISRNDQDSFRELSVIYYIGSKYIYQVETI